MVVKLLVVSMIGIVASMAHPHSDSFAEGYNSLAARDILHSRRTADLNFPSRLIPRSHRQPNLLRRASKGAALSGSVSAPMSSGPSKQQAGLSRPTMSAPKSMPGGAGPPRQQNTGPSQRSQGPSHRGQGDQQSLAGGGNIKAGRAPSSGGLKVIPPTPWTSERTAEFQKLAMKHGKFDRPDGTGRVPMSAVSHLL